MTPSRLEAARHAVESAGAALMNLRGKMPQGRNAGHGQLKTAADAAAEGWVLGYLRDAFPGDEFLCEESFESAGAPWKAPRAFWTVDALDGTRSFAEGFDGFCVQAAYVEGGAITLGVIHEPVRQTTYWAEAGKGAFSSRGPEGGPKRLSCRAEAGGPSWPKRPVFVDSKPPSGPAGDLMGRVSGRFLECGSIGLKICRVAEGSADVFAKALLFKLWDAAPGEIILAEAGGRLGLWTGEPIPYGGNQVYFENILAARPSIFEAASKTLAQAVPEHA